MTDDNPEPTAAEKVMATMDDFVATLLRHLRTGEGDPLEELGLAKSSEELQNWRPDVPGALTDLGHPRLRLARRPV
jgi:hypothetical protein